MGGWNLARLNGKISLRENRRVQIVSLHGIRALICQTAENEEWSALADDVRTLVLTANLPDLSLFQSAQV